MVQPILSPAPPRNSSRVRASWMRNETYLAATPEGFLIVGNPCPIGSPAAAGIRATARR